MDSPEYTDNTFTRSTLSNLMPSHAFWKYCNDWKSLSVQPLCTPICRISKAQSALTGLGYTKEYGWLMSWLYLNNHILPAWCNHSLYRQKTARAAMEKELAQTSYWWQGQPLPWLQTSTRPNRDFARALSLSHSLSLSDAHTHERMHTYTLHRRLGSLNTGLCSHSNLSDQRQLQNYDRKRPTGLTERRKEKKGRRCIFILASLDSLFSVL